MKIYVASSWRNIYQHTVVGLLRGLGHEVYDFKNPKAGDNGFHWSAIGKGWKEWSLEEYRAGLANPIAEQGYASDFDAMKWADACVLVMPAGKSSHLELGWCAGAGKRTAIFYPTDVPPSDMDGHRVHGGACPGCGDLDGCWLPGKLKRDFEPELMNKLADAVLLNTPELTGWVDDQKRAKCLGATRV